MYQVHGHLCTGYSHAHIQSIFFPSYRKLIKIEFQIIVDGPSVNVVVVVMMECVWTVLSACKIPYLHHIICVHTDEYTPLVFRERDQIYGINFRWYKLFLFSDVLFIFLLSLSLFFCLYWWQQIMPNAFRCLGYLFLSFFFTSFSFQKNPECS